MKTALGILVAGALGLIVYSDVPAQMPFSTLCQTRVGICQIPGGPIGAQCFCGRDPGQIISPPPNSSNACGTRRGVCRVDYGQVGSPCMCPGGEYGQRIYAR